MTEAEKVHGFLIDVSNQKIKGKKIKLIIIIKLGNIKYYYYFATYT